MRWFLKVRPSGLAICVACGVAGVVLLLGLSLASAATPQRAQGVRVTPGLVISGGSLREVAGSLKGSLSVRNDGPGQSAAAQVTLQILAGKKRVVIKRYALGRLLAHRGVTEHPTVKVPPGLPVGRLTVQACAGRGAHYAGANGPHCRAVGTLVVTRAPVSPPVKPTPTTTTTTTTAAPPPSTMTAPVTTTPPPTPPTSTTPMAPVSSVPTNPAGYEADMPEFFADGLGQYNNYEGDADAPASDFTDGYYIDVPSSYDATNQTPETLVVWLHGCYGAARYDIYHLTSYYDSDRPFIMAALQGPDAAGSGDGSECWNVDDADVSRIQTDITQIKTQFNINPRRVILAGYSSGGDLAYRTIWEDSDAFAGILAQNTNPFRDTGLTQAQALGDASWTFNDIHVATASDGEYHLDACGDPGQPACQPDPGGGENTAPDPGVQPAITAMQAAGFAADLIVHPGGHYDNDSCATESAACTGTYNDINVFLLSTVGTDGWEAP